jgi:uncharacterized damage-inducible protein DinB
MVNYGVKELAEAFRTVRRNTIQVAKDIPENKYSFAPAPGVRSVADTLRHIATIVTLHYSFHGEKKLSTLQGYDFDAYNKHRVEHEASMPTDKAGIIALLEKEGDKFAKWVESLSDAFLNETYTDHMGQNPKTRFEHLLSAKEHEMHHRGQLMLVERMVGVTPHLTVQAQERVRARTAAKAGAGKA